MCRDIRAEGVYITLAFLLALELFWEEEDEDEEMACSTAREEKVSGLYMVREMVESNEEINGRKGVIHGEYLVTF